MGFELASLEKTIWLDHYDNDSLDAVFAFLEEFKGLLLDLQNIAIKCKYLESRKEEVEIKKDISWISYDMQGLLDFAAETPLMYEEDCIALANAWYDLKEIAESNSIDILSYENIHRIWENAYYNWSALRNLFFSEGYYRELERLEREKFDYDVR